MKREQQIQTHFSKLTVKVLSYQGGNGVFNVSCFEPGVAYRVLATYIKKWDDGSADPVFLLQGPGDRVVEKACNRFLVTEVS